MYEALRKLLVNFEKRLKRLEDNTTFATLVFPADGKFVVPAMTSDPASPTDGEIWYNSTSNTYKGRENGVTVTFTTT